MFEFLCDAKISKNFLTPCKYRQFLRFLNKIARIGYSVVRSAKQLRAQLQARDLYLLSEEERMYCCEAKQSEAKHEERSDEEENEVITKKEDTNHESYSSESKRRVSTLKQSEARRTMSEDER